MVRSDLLESFWVVLGCVLGVFCLVLSTAPIPSMFLHINTDFGLSACEQNPAEGPNDATATALMHHKSLKRSEMRASDLGAYYRQYRAEFGLATQPLDNSHFKTFACTSTRLDTDHKPSIDFPILELLNCLLNSVLTCFMDSRCIFSSRDNRQGFLRIFLSTRCRPVNSDPPGDIVLGRY